MAADLNLLAQSIIGGKKNDAVAIVNEALAEGVYVGDIITLGLIAGMNVVGSKFKANEFYVPEVLIAARAMKSCMEILKPLLEESGVEPAGTVVIGTVKGDLHDIGKNLVAMMLQGNGFDVIDLGVDVEAENYVNTAIEKGADIIALSALLTTTMPSMKSTIDVLNASEGKGKIKVMIGGAPVTQKFADEIGADGYSSDAASAVDLAKSLVL